MKQVLGSIWKSIIFLPNYINFHSNTDISQISYFFYSTKSKFLPQNACILNFGGYKLIGPTVSRGLIANTYEARN